jgi:hypothetical protein
VLEPSEWTLLQYFVNVLYLRNPSNTSKVKEYVGNAQNLSAFHLNLLDSISGERKSNKEERTIICHPDFYKIARERLPRVTFPETFKQEVNDNAHIFTLPAKLPKLVSDNPIIMEKEEWSRCIKMHFYPPSRLLKHC